MTEFRRVTDNFSVAYQLDPADLKAAAAQGFTLVINNRPDGEDPSQTPCAQMQAAAEAAGLRFVFAPVVGRPTRETAEAVHQAISGADGKVLAYCRTGTRSINTWALGQALHGGDHRELLQLGAQAGYDLSAILS
jgi:uncharacterized protein (TIGR01244 family)